MKLVLYESDRKRAERLCRRLSGISCVTIKVGTESDLIRSYPADVDSIYVSLFVAERWGALPKIREIQILPTSSEDRTNGLPPYMVAGLATRPGDRTPEAELMLLALEKARDAIAAHNEQWTPIYRLGVMLRDLAARDMTDDEVARILERFCGGKE